MSWGLSYEMMAGYMADLGILLGRYHLTALIGYALLGALVASAILFWLHSNR